MSLVGLTIIAITVCAHTHSHTHRTGGRGMLDKKYLLRHKYGAHMIDGECHSAHCIYCRTDSSNVILWPFPSAGHTPMILAWERFNAQNWKKKKTFFWLFGEERSERPDVNWWRVFALFYSQNPNRAATKIVMNNCAFPCAFKHEILLFFLFALLCSPIQNTAFPRSPFAAGI